MLISAKIASFDLSWINCRWVEIQLLSSDSFVRLSETKYLDENSEIEVFERQ